MSKKKFAVLFSLPLLLFFLMSTNPASRKLKTISDLISASHSCPPTGQDLTFAIQAKITKIFTSQNMTYRACSICTKSICLIHDNQQTHRYRVKILVSDNTGTTSLILFDSDGQDIFRVPATTIFESKNKVDGHAKISDIVSKVMHRSYIFRIKITSDNFQYLGRNGYTVTGIEWLPRAFKPNCNIEPSSGPSTSFNPAPSAIPSSTSAKSPSSSSQSDN